VKKVAIQSGSDSGIRLWLSDESGDGGSGSAQCQFCGAKLTEHQIILGALHFKQVISCRKCADSHHIVEEQPYGEEGEGLW